MEGHSKALGCIKTVDLIKYGAGIAGTLIGTAMVIGLWVRSVERDALFATEQIHTLQDRSERLEDQLGMINERLSRIEGKLDFVLKSKR